MVKKLLIVLMILFSLVLVSAAGTLQQPSVTTPVTGYPGETKDITFTVSGVGDTISSVSLISTDLTYNTNTISAPTIGSVTNLVSGVSQTVVLSMPVPALLAGTYTGTVTATNADNTLDIRTVDYSLIIQTKDNFVITEDSLVLSGQEEETDSGVINIENTGSTTLTITSTDVTFVVADFTDSDDRVVDLSVTDVTIAPGATGQMTFTAVIPDKMDLDTYSGTVTITEGVVVDTFSLEVGVQPEICKKGEVGSALELDVDNPDDDDEYAPGETISIEVNVANDGNDDKDVRVEAFLYDLDSGDKIADVESDTIEVEEDEDEDFDLELEIPSDSDIDDDNNFVLYIKAYEKGDESDECVEEAIDIDIEREDHAMDFSQFTLSPATVNCGDVVDATVTVENIGKKNEDDVTIRLLSSDLGLDETSSPFDVYKATRDDNDYTARFSFSVPQGLTAESYSIEAVATFDDGNEQKSGWATLNIGQCAPAVGQASNVLLEVAEIGGEVNEGQSISVPVKLTSNELGAQPYDISIDNVVGWASAVPMQTLTLEKEQSETAYFYLKAQDDLEEGIYTAVVNVKSGSNVVATKTLSFEVKESSGVFDALEGTSLFWIIGDIVLVILAVFFVKLIFSGRKGPREVNL